MPQKQVPKFTQCYKTGNVGNKSQDFQ